MMMTNQKEQSLLKDLKKEEKICAEKYARYAQMAADPQLQTLLLQIAKTEQGHLQTLTQMENGKVPSMSGASGGS
ncbi:MAG: spore coat protein, partial [Candidatus Heritagella sp.]|nr:spore coat protein [Candidatus Heritagella sp.]